MLEKLNPNLQTRILSNINKDPLFIEEAKNAKSISDFINSFVWDKTPEGYYYWEDVYKHFLAEESSKSHTEPKNRNKHRTIKNYIEYNYTIDVNDRFNIGDKVITYGGKGGVIDSRFIWEQGKPYVINFYDGSIHTEIERNLKFNNNIMNKKLFGLDVEISNDSGTLLVECDGFRSFTMNYFGIPEEFYEENKELIYKWFEQQIERRADDTLRHLKDDMKKAKHKLQDIVLPRTKEILLAKTFDVIKGGVTDIAELYEDPTIKKQILNLLNKKI